MKIEQDSEEGTMYIELGEGLIKRTEECALEVFLDFDEQGNLLGVELINLRGKSMRRYHLLWWWREIKIKVPDFRCGHGYWPGKNYRRQIFEYWHICPIEIRRLCQKVGDPVRLGGEARRGLTIFYNMLYYR